MADEYDGVESRTTIGDYFLDEFTADHRDCFASDYSIFSSPPGSESSDDNCRKEVAAIERRHFPSHHQPIVPISTTAMRTEDDRGNILGKVIDGVDIKRRNTSVSVRRRRRRRREENRRRRHSFCDLGSFLFSPSAPTAMEDNGRRAGPTTSVNDDDDDDSHIRRGGRSTMADFYDNLRRRLYWPRASGISSSSSTSRTSDYDSNMATRRTRRTSSAFRHLLTLAFCFLCFSSIISSVASSRATDDDSDTPPPSQSASTSSSDGLAAPNYYGDGDSSNSERHGNQRYKKLYTNQWAVEIVGGSDDAADQIARRHGFTYLGRVVGDYFLFSSDRMRRKRSTRRARYLQYELGREPQVIWLEQQVAKRRVKRDYLPPNDPRSRNRRQTTAENTNRDDERARRDNPIFLQQQQRQQQQQHSNGQNAFSNRQQPKQPCQLNHDHGIHSPDCPDSAAMASSAAASLPYGDSNVDRSRQYLDDFRHRLAFAGANGAWNVLGGGGGGNPIGGAAAVYRPPNDPEWSEMWYLNRGAGLDHNVKEAWQLGVTGRDVVVTILDDGLEHTHPDIHANYDPQASFDINDSDVDPMPRYDLTNENRHGTRCAGEVAAVYNNSLCIVGIAFGARIGGIRMLDGEVTDAVEAASLSHNRNHIDIYSASWGPDDDGKTVDGPARMAQQAFKEGIEYGRRGKGSIFIWASGNGGRDADSCNCDGYTNSIYTLSISSATENGNVPWYSEACSSTLASTYSSGSHSEKMIVTTDLHHGCTNSHTGTSASAPLAAGICALALEANPALTWRDLQHIVVRTAKPDHLKANDWVINGVGRNVSHSFGFGLMDAGGMVRLAKNWTLVPPQKRCAVRYEGGVKQIPQRTTLQVSLTTDGCVEDDADMRVAHLEHVQARITLSAQKRGDIQIFLTSPHGTKSTLLAKRARDAAKNGFRDWAFMTTHSWGESALGPWRLEIQNDGFSDATLFKWELVLYGTSVYVGPYGGFDGGAGVTNNHVQRSEGSQWSAPGSNGAASSMVVSSPTNCCLTTPLGLCAVCRQGLALYQNRCLRECPSHHYMRRSSYRIPDSNETSSIAEMARCTLCHPSCVQCNGPRSIDCAVCVVGYGRRNGDGEECVRRFHQGHYAGQFKQSSSMTAGGGNLTLRQYPGSMGSAKLGSASAANGHLSALTTVGVVGLVILIVMALVTVYYQCYQVARPQAKCDRRMYELDLTGLQSMVALEELGEGHHDQHRGVRVVRGGRTRVPVVVHESRM